MDVLHWKIIRALERVRFYPGSWDKSFARDMAALGEYDMLTPKQGACLEGMAWKYRKQIGRIMVLKPKSDKGPSASDLQALEDWKAGKPL